MLADTPVRRGSLQALVFLEPGLGLTGRVEAGYRPWAHVGLFGYGQVDRLGLSGGLGARLEF